MIDGFSVFAILRRLSAGEVCVPFESLVGEWTLTSLIEDGVEVDLGETIVVFTFMNDGTLTESVTGEEPENSTYIQTDANLLICDPGCDEILDYNISGNTLTISFDGNEETAPFTATFVRD